MLVCHCRAVNERRVREVIEHGARDEFDIAEACGAGGDCGGCVPVISDILAESGCATRCSVASALRPAVDHVTNGLDSIPAHP